MRYSGTWLIPEDEAILEHLAEHGPATPDELARPGGLGYGESFLRQRCSKLAGIGGLVAFERDVYRLTPAGEAYLDGELDPAEIESE